MRYLLLIIMALTLLPSCGFSLTAIEQGFNGGVRYSESGGENYAEQTTGHYEQRGDWYVGGDVRFIYTRR